MKKQSQNKPNLKKAKMDVNLFATKDYENETAFRLQKYKPKQTQFQTGHRCPERRLVGRSVWNGLNDDVHISYLEQH